MFSFPFVSTEAPPQRPSSGPAAKIDISLSEDGVEDGALMNGNYSNSSQNANENMGRNVPSKQLANKEIFSTANTPISEEDLIRHSAAYELLPAVTMLLSNSSSHPPGNQANVPTTATSESNSSHHSSHSTSRSSDINLGSEPDSDIVPNITLLNNIPDILPNITLFNNTQSSDTNNSNGNHQDIINEDIPNLSGLNLRDVEQVDEQEHAGYIPLVSLMNQS